MKAQAKPLTVSWRQNGNQATVLLGDAAVTMDVEGHQLGTISDGSFALWLALPYAMQRGQDIELLQPVDSVALGNARKLIEAWAQWVPETYRLIRILNPSSTKTIDPAPAGRLFFYSGGADSAHMLVTRSPSSDQDAALTICGLDYKTKGPAFSRLLEKTNPLLTELGLERIIIQTNAARLIGNLKLNHGFVLAACGFLFGNHFGSSHLAGDAKPVSEFLTFPWGSNSITNPLFASQTHRMVTEDLDKGRTQKIATLNTRPEVLHTLSFCSDSKHRPDNCGRCAKCVRTKLRFVLLDGAVPPIFNDNTFTTNMVRKMDVRDRVVRQTFLTISAESGAEADGPILNVMREMLQRYYERRKWLATAGKLGSKFKRNVLGRK